MMQTRKKLREIEAMLSEKRDEQKAAEEAVRELELQMTMNKETLLECLVDVHAYTDQFADDHQVFN